MPRRAGPDDAEALARRRRRHAADVARWRSRQRREVELFQIEAGPQDYDLCIKFGFLHESQVHNKVAVAVALGKLLRAGKIALLERDRASRKM